LILFIIAISLISAVFGFQLLPMAISIIFFA
jgi:hypothetical protein